MQPQSPQPPVNPHWSPAPAPQEPHPMTPPPDSGAQHYPQLSLSPGEYVVRFIRRHPIGLFRIYILAALAQLGILAGTIALIGTLQNEQNSILNNLNIDIPAIAIIALGIGLALFALLITAVATKVYNGNQLYITNESIIQRIQVSLFAAKEQVISLGNIEDASYEQRGVVAHLLDYGRVRLSTEGEHTYYDFKYASDPKEVARLINDAHEHFVKSQPDAHN